MFQPPTNERLALFRIFLANAPYITDSQWRDFPCEWRAAYHLASDLVISRIRTSRNGHLLPTRLAQADILAALEIVYALGLFLKHRDSN